MARMAHDSPALRAVAPDAREPATAPAPTTAALDLFDREADAFERAAQDYLAAAREELPDDLAGVVAHEGGAILAAAQRIARAVARTHGARP
jgi:hypothetical protein